MDAPTSAGPANTISPFNVFPNPFDGSATVSFYMAKTGNVTINLFSALGQLISTSELGSLTSGQHEAAIDGQKLAAGMYILQLNTGTSVFSRKVSVIH